MAEPYKHIYKVDLNQQLVRRDVGLLATFDSKANRFGAELYRDGAAVNDLSGCAVTGYFIRPNEETVHNPGVISGNQVYVDLLPACYLYDGAFEFTLKIKHGDVEQAVLMCYGTVERSRTDATASGGDVIVTVNNSEKLGGKPPEYYIQPRNLLVNGDFRIAQAGYGGLHGTIRYVCDMWYNLFGFGEFSFDKSNGLTMAYKDNHAYACQKIENDDLYVGKPLTFAVCLSDGTVHVCSGVYTNTTATAVKDSGSWIIGIYEGEVRIIVVEGSVTIKWAALYEGTYTADTLPPYVPKGYAAELSACQYYANVIEVDAWGRLGFCKTTQGETATIWAPTTPPMRPGGVPSVAILEGTIESFSVEFNQLVATSMSGFGCQSGNHHNILVNLSGNATASVVEPLRNRTENKVKVLISRDL